MTTQSIVSEIETLPKECLSEVLNFIAFLRYKAGVSYTDLEEGYKTMAADEEYEKEAKAMADQIRAVDKSRLKNEISVLSLQDMQKIDTIVKVHLALG